MAHPATTHIVSKSKFLEGKAVDFAFSARRAIDTIAVGFEDALEFHPVLARVLFSLLYFSWARLVSNHKQLWFDELVTSSVDHAANWSSAWHFLAIGVDANPPLFHLVNRFLLSLFGDSVLIQRASSILGFWVMLLCVQHVVRRAHSAAAAWVAAVLPVVSGAAYYATEARPYGMVLGFVALAVVCWLKVTDSSAVSRGWWMAGLGTCLACAVSSHYYAVFTVIPFLGAELTRSMRRSRTDFALVGTLLTSYLPLGIFYAGGLVSAANQYSGKTDGASLTSPVEFWSSILGPAIASILAAVFLAMLLRQFDIHRRKLVFPVESSPATILIAIWFCILPFAVTLAGRYVTHAYERRYAITAVIGAAILIGIGFDALRSAIPGAAGVALVVLILPVLATSVAGRDKPQGRHIDYAWAQAVEARPDLPVAYGMPLEFVQAWYNAPNEKLKQRILGLVNVDEGKARTGNEAADLYVVNLKPAMPVPAMSYGEFIRGRQSFYLIDEPAIISWVTAKLIQDGANLKLVGLYGADQLYLVTWNRIAIDDQAGLHH